MQNTTKIKFISSHHEIGNVWTFKFEPDGLSWLPGQYQAYTFPEISDDENENTHWFTISSAPSEGTINISTRLTGSKFKNALRDMKPGNEINRFDLGGEFTWEETDKPVVLVAAGIGVTPYRSMFVERISQNKPLNAILLYYNRINEIPFLDLFEEIASKHSEFKLKTIVGERITSQSILNLASQSKEQVVYLSGAKPMVLALTDELEKEGIEVKQDRFPGYDENTY